MEVKCERRARQVPFAAAISTLRFEKKPYYAPGVSFVQFDSRAAIISAIPTDAGGRGKIADPAAHLPDIHRTLILKPPQSRHADVTP